MKLQAEPCLRCPGVLPDSVTLEEAPGKPRATRQKEDPTLPAKNDCLWASGFVGRVMNT